MNLRCGLVLLGMGLSQISLGATEMIIHCERKDNGKSESLTVTKDEEGEYRFDVVSEGFHDFGKARASNSGGYKRFFIRRWVEITAHPYTGADYYDTGIGRTLSFGFDECDRL